MVSLTLTPPAPWQAAHTVATFALPASISAASAAGAIANTTASPSSFLMGLPPVMALYQDRLRRRYEDDQILEPGNAGSGARRGRARMRRGGLSRAAGRQLGGARLPLPQRRSPVRAAPALPHRRRARRPARRGAARHDAVGHGKSSKPSDGLRTRFPRYNYDDMVDASHRLVTEHLGVHRARLVIGNSMGGMQTWIWAQKYPGFMDVAVPMASLPAEMSSRNWMMRRLIVDSIRNDPERMNGNYTKQPRSAQFASVFYGIATNGGSQALYKTAPTREKADQLLDQRLSAPFTGDANDHLYQWDSSRDYNPSVGLERIQAVLLAINSADDERNPPENGVLDREIKRVKNGRVYLIPASDQTAGHGTTGQAKFWKQQLAELLQTAPRGAN